MHESIQRAVTTAIETFAEMVTIRNEGGEFAVTAAIRRTTGGETFATVSIPAGVLQDAPHRGDTILWREHRLAIVRAELDGYRWTLDVRLAGRA